MKRWTTDALALPAGLHHRPTDRLECRGALTSECGAGLPTAHVCFRELHP